ncbi:MAG: 3-isopropylmalate dehydrogenase, partial [Acidobacteriota bacterium]|nr:3-isopropylmalate dehydrogenase [Acidobacteriota bacterium]
MKKIAVIPGDGIGPEVIAAGIRILTRVNDERNLGLELVHFGWNADEFLRTGISIPPGGMDDIRNNYAAVYLGAFGDPRIPDMKHAADILLGMRFQLDLYVNYRPVKLLNESLCPLKGKTRQDVDFVIFRENTEGAYVGMGGNFKKGTSDEIAVQEDVSTRKGVERIIRYTFEFAKKTGRKSVCMADKSNVMRFGGDLWLRTFEEVAKEYPDIDHVHMFVDALTMQMVHAPEMFDVIVTNNMFGDIVTDLGAALQGGLGMAASGNIHPGKVSLFEPIHGSAPKYAGKDVANPIGAILTAAMMLDYLGCNAEADAIERAVVAAIDAGETTH